MREAGYHSLHASPSASKAAGLTLIHTPNTSGKFGKRVYMGNYQMSDKDVFDLHMQQIKSKGSVQTFDREVKIREEQEFSRFVQDQLRKDREKQDQIQKLMQIDFIEANAAKQIDNEKKKKVETQVKMQETYKYFPYTGSEEVERKRIELKES